MERPCCTASVLQRFNWRLPRRSLVLNYLVVGIALGLIHIINTTSDSTAALFNGTTLISKLLVKHVLHRRWNSADKAATVGLFQFLPRNLDHELLFLKKTIFKPHCIVTLLSPNYETLSYYQRFGRKLPRLLSTQQQTLFQWQRCHF